MKYEEKRTLAYYNAAPQLKLLNVSNIPVKDVGANCNLYRSAAGQVLPDSEAVSFYGLNHLASVVRAKFTEHEPLPEWAVKVMDAYTEVMATQGQRMFFYLALICTRESRHAGQKSGLNVTAVSDNITEKFFTSLKGLGSSGAAQKFWESPPDTTLGKYAAAMTHIFYKGSFGGGFGGKAWGKVADTFESFVTGKTSLEMMVDTAYTLAHNNGPIFNKGMLYTHYTHEITRILDIQRSGQIPEYILHEGTQAAEATTNAKVKALVEMVDKEFPDLFGKYVDYIKVQQLGSVKSYPAEIEAQKKKHGDITKPKLAKGEEVVGKFQVDLNNTVTIYKRKASAVAA